MTEPYIVTWLALAVVGLIACLSAGLGLLLYRYSAVIVDQKAVRMAGAAAIAWIFFLGMGNFYINVVADLQKQQASAQTEAAEALARSAAEVFDRANSYRECALHIGNFQCKEPANQLLRACTSLSSQAQ